MEKKQKFTKAIAMGCGLFPILLTVLFIDLKVKGIITWSWLWVASPICIGCGLAIAAIVLFILWAFFTSPMRR